MKSNNSAFTLMEILLVSVLIASVSIAIFSVLNNGVKLWGRGIAVDKKGDLFIGVERIAQDIRCALPFSQIRFHGSQSKVSFATIVLTPADAYGSRAQEGLIDEIGAVEYRFEPSEGKIFRRQAGYGQALKNQWGGDQEIASGLTDVRFDYFVGHGKKTDSKTSVESTVPSAVKLTVSMGDHNQQTLQRFFEIPVGGQ